MTKRWKEKARFYPQPKYVLFAERESSLRIEGSEYLYQEEVRTIKYGINLEMKQENKLARGGERQGKADSLGIRKEMCEISNSWAAFIFTQNKA